MKRKPRYVVTDDPEIVEACRAEDAAYEWAILDTDDNTATGFPDRRMAEWWVRECNNEDRKRGGGWFRVNSFRMACKRAREKAQA